VGNPGPGGYGAILIYGEARKELQGGARLTTNNRMELLAVIKGLEALKEACDVAVFSDSEYVGRALREGWATRWRANNWRKADRSPVLNIDLWKRLLGLCEFHRVEVTWVRGHAGHPENERCDFLATSAAKWTDLEADLGYESVAPGRSALL
jgi:ribonuclease HI